MMRAERGSPNRRGADDLQECVHRAAEQCLQRDGAVGPLELAVIAWIRHQRTTYDTLLMQGTDRLSAREAIQPEIERVRSRWSQSGRLLA